MDEFAFEREVWKTAEACDKIHNAVYKPTPQNDRKIDNDLILTFSLMRENQEIAVLDITFPMIAYVGETPLQKKHNLVLAGVVHFKNQDVEKILRIADVPFASLGTAFNPMAMIHYGVDAKVYYAEEREKRN